MSLENIRLSKQGRDQLMTLKRRTGVEHWNILCRWAFCVSLAEPSPPRDQRVPADSTVEMTWRTFGGEQDAVYRAALVQRCHEDGFETDDETLLRQFRLHLHRGIGYLAGDPNVKSIAGLVDKAHCVENQAS